MIQNDCLSLDDISLRTGESPKRLLRWRDAGLLGCEDSGFRAEDVGRARLIHDMLHYGHSLEAIAAAFKEPDSIFRYFVEDMQEQFTRQLYTIQDAAEITGLEIDCLRRIIDATAIGEAGEMVDAKDIDFFRSAGIALQAGYPEEALLQILHVYSEAMDRAAEVGTRTSHFYIHERMKHENLSPEDLMCRLESTFSKVEPLIEPALMYFHDKGRRRAMWDDMLMHLEEEAGLTDEPEAPGQIRRAVMFVDLASFTPLAEAMGDVAAAEVLERFARIVRTAVRPSHGRIVKQIGDAFMIVFAECNSAVGCAVYLERRAAMEPHFPAVRAGIHWGPILYREADYFGSNVNIASRLGVEADRHQILVTDEVRRRAKMRDDIEFLPLGRRRLKGLAAEVEVYEARLAKSEEGSKATDPVCKMELTPVEVAARLTLDGREQVFCSDTCLRSFVAAPEKYAA